ncbi:MAG TPA: VWA domain-containing protein, partial [Vicinamibacterales bacterium]|nr:VWA domain-containing protein [Vicinamibacterales bacterium]
MRTHLVSALLVVINAAAVAGQGQAPLPPSATFKSGVDVIQLDVTVTDRQRRPIRGLTAADFTVLEDGVVQPISTFKAVDLPDATAFAAPWMRDVAPDVVFNRIDAERVILILLDDFHVSSDPMDAETTRKIARAIVDEMGPLDMAGVMYTFQQNNSQEFTTDRTRLTDAVNRFSSQGFPPGSDRAPSGACQGGSCVFAALQQAARALDGWPGKRKTIAFISPQPAFNFNVNIEQNAIMDNINARNDAGDLQQTFKALREAHANVYQYDPRGVMGGGLDPNFGVFADNTGGRAVSFNNTPWTRVPELFVENNSFYMMGYLPSNTATDGKFRSIAVRVNRPDALVSTRSGYYAPDAKKLAKAEKKLPPSVLDRAMTSLLPNGDLSIGLNVVPFAVPNQV